MPPSAGGAQPPPLQPQQPQLPPKPVNLRRLLYPPPPGSAAAGRHALPQQRPPWLLLILRGIPGSGKSAVAKKIKELEAERGGAAPRVHCIDDYYMNVSHDGSNLISSCVIFADKLSVACCVMQ